jgi:superfamily II RNA helicase
MKLIEILKKPTITEKEMKQQYEFIGVIGVGLIVNLLILISSIYSNFQMLVFMFSFVSFQNIYFLNQQIKKIKIYQQNKKEIKDEILHFINANYEGFVQELESLIKSKKDLQQQEHILEKISLNQIIKNKLNDFIDYLNEVKKFHLDKKINNLQNITLNKLEKKEENEKYLEEEKEIHYGIKYKL